MGTSVDSQSKEIGKDTVGFSGESAVCPPFQHSSHRVRSAAQAPCLSNQSINYQYFKRPDAALLLILVPFHFPCFVSLVFAWQLASEVTTTLTWCHFFTIINSHSDMVTITHVLFLVRRCYIYAGVNKKPFSGLFGLDSMLKIAGKWLLGVQLL